MFYQIKSRLNLELMDSKVQTTEVSSKRERRLISLLLMKL